MKDKPQTLRAAMCRSCIFREPCRRLEISPERMAEIQAYLVTGQPHTCHAEHEGETQDAFLCRGARNYQLTLWGRLGLIQEPTDDALEAAMIAAGVTPGWSREQTVMTNQGLSSVANRRRRRSPRKKKPS